MLFTKIAISGYFDPLHCGHVRMMKEAVYLFGDEVHVILNNRDQCLLKKGYEFMPMNEKIEILKSIKYVKDVIRSEDADGTVRKTLRMMEPSIFVKGGYEYNESNLPEMDVCRELGIKVFFGIGGAKVQSSSLLVSDIAKFKIK